MRITVALLSMLLATCAAAQGNDVSQKIKDALASDVRSEEDTSRDENRLPLQTLEFLRLEDDMRVLEMLPGGGWYTKILAPVLRENGELYVSIGTNTIRDNLLKVPGFEHVQVLETGVEMVRDGPFRTYNMPAFDFGVKNLDLALTFRNMHNFTEAGRDSINNGVFAALRAGGLYGVIDHSRRHMEPMTNENRRRVDVVQIIKEVQEAGFELVDYSGLHYRPDDELRYEVGRHTVTGNTDRFTLLFQKP